MLKIIWLYFILTFGHRTILFILSFYGKYHEDFVFYALHRFAFRIFHLSPFFVVGEFHRERSFFWTKHESKYLHESIFIFFLGPERCRNMIWGSKYNSQVNGKFWKICINQCWAFMASIYQLYLLSSIELEPVKRKILFFRFWNILLKTDSHHADKMWQTEELTPVCHISSNCSRPFKNNDPTPALI